MKLIKSYLIIVLCFLTHAAKAQDQVSDKRISFTLLDYKVGYSGNIIWQNGLIFGVDYPWKEKIKIKEGRKGNKTITKEILLNGNIGFTTNLLSKTDTGIFTNYGFIFRRTNHKGKQINLEFNPLGYYRSFLPETYEFKNNTVKKVPLPGRGYYAPSLAVGIGRFRKEKKLNSWYLNLNIMLRTPYNGGTLPSVALQYGYRFKFKKK